MHFLRGRVATTGRGWVQKSENSPLNWPDPVHIPKKNDENQSIYRRQTLRAIGHAFLLSESQYLNSLFHHISWNLAWIMSKLQHFICKTKKIFSFGFPLDPRLSSQIQRNSSGSPPDFHEISAFLTTGLFYSESIIYSGFTDVFLSCWTFPAAYFLGFQMKFLARSGSFWNSTFAGHLAAF